MASLGGSYSPEEVTILLAGFIAVEGYVEDVFVDLSKDIVPFKSVRTADGMISRIYDNDSTYTLRLTLMSTSKTNDVLTKLWQLDELTQRGKFPVFIKDKSGSSLFFSPTAWIEGIPSMSLSEKIESRTWVIRCASGVLNVGGNGDTESSLIQDIINIASAASPIIEGLF